MEDKKDTKVAGYLPSPKSNQNGTNNSSEYREETAAEIAAPVPITRPNFQEKSKDGSGAGTGTNAGTGMGWAALALSILSLFVMPILFGAAGIVLGFVARRRGADSLGAWAIGIGAISIIVGIFILPFF
ncbi:hypothetical protein QFZ28_001890 [Neobacillus niacini]|jgi:hypothetical protein|uniref:DUF4190 domain-containing protein n=1 Tax=Neobacillus niacini TaxID=86668 RepID=UPI0027878568|nr:DUF4190 domain-containing protein [Neobacillus niacini]MDQ1001490.1 hypothetical protein [Neobacillus niacini]